MDLDHLTATGLRFRSSSGVWSSFGRGCDPGSRRLVEAKAALDSFTEVMTALQAGQVQQSETNTVFREDLDSLADRLDREFPAGGTPFRDRLSALEAKVSTILELLRSARSIDNPGVA